MNNKPVLQHDTANVSSKLSDQGAGASPYVFSPKDTAFTVCFVWKPFAGGSGQRFLSYPHVDWHAGGVSDYDSYLLKFTDDANELTINFNNGTEQTVAYGNDDTEGVRYLFMCGGGGDPVVITETTTGVDTAISIDGTNSATYAVDGVVVYNQQSFFMEYLKLEYAASASDRANLLAFWQDKYEV